MTFKIPREEYPANALISQSIWEYEFSGCNLKIVDDLQKKALREVNSSDLPSSERRLLILLFSVYKEHSIDEIMQIAQREFGCSLQDIFGAAVVLGNNNVLDKIAKQLPSKELLNLIKDGGCFAFCNAVAYGHLDTLEWLVKKVPDGPRIMIMTGGRRALLGAVEGGSLETLNWLAEKAPDEFLRILDTAAGPRALQIAKGKNHTEIFDWLVERKNRLADEKKRRNFSQFPDDFQQKKSAILKTIQAYKDYNSSSCKFSIFHRHGARGQARADSLKLDIERVTTLNGLNKIISNFCMDKTQGNTHPHSLRTMLFHCACDKSADYTLQDAAADLKEAVKELPQMLHLST